jgi:NAD(P)-dependent dehydrogenase (short-subunit alcohol dehydrogenase family)
MAPALSGRVAVVTGGGGGIGSASALELARQGATVIAMDPGVGVQGEDLKEPTAADTVRRIRAEGGTAFDSTVSVTDLTAVAELFPQIKRDHGSLDVVVNTAGILRFARLVEATEDDWFAVLNVHFNGYLNILATALPLMIESGYGRVVGFTSGVGLARTSADSLAYGCAKRSVAALTWALGPLMPDGININALSPIAGTRMVRDALVASGASPRGLDLTAMPQAEDMAPGAAYLSGDRLDWCRGQVIFSAGSELTTIGRPRLIEAVRTEGVQDFATALGTLVPVILHPGEVEQRTSGGSNPRLGDVFSASPSSPGRAEPSASCLIVSDDTSLAAAVAAAVQNWGLNPVGVGAWQPFDSGAATLPSDFDAVETTLDRAAATTGPIAAVVIATTAEQSLNRSAETEWESLVESHRGVVPRLLTHAAWLRAGARFAETRGTALRLVHLNGATTQAGQSAGQAITQMSRSANDTPLGASLATFSVVIETGSGSEHRAIGDLVARLAATEDGLSLKGAELVASEGWVGLRCHPGPIATATFGGREIPASVDRFIRAAI